MQPKELITRWVKAVNDGDAGLLSGFYADSAVHHHIPESPVQGKEAIMDMFNREFSQARINFMVQNIFENGEWAILEWKDPWGQKGCDFFQVKDGKIIYERGYQWMSSQLSPVPENRYKCRG